MRISLIIASSALLLAVGAAVPGKPKLGYDATAFRGTGGPYDELTGGYPTASRTHYRPCRPGPGDDHCIQLYERGVRAALARRGGGSSAGVGGPVEAGAYPVCSRTVTDRCIQRSSRRSAPVPARTRRVPDRSGPSTPGI